MSTRKMLLERMKSRDLPAELLEEEEVVNQKLKEQADSAQANAAAMSAKMNAEIRALVAGAFKDFALAIKAQTSANVDTFNAVVEGIANGTDQGKGTGTSAAGGTKSAGAGA